MLKGWQGSRGRPAAKRSRCSTGVKRSGRPRPLCCAASASFPIQLLTLRDVTKATGMQERMEGALAQTFLNLRPSGYFWRQFSVRAHTSVDTSLFQMSICILSPQTCIMLPTSVPL